MHGSYIIYGGNDSARKKTLGELLAQVDIQKLNQNPDVFELDIPNDKKSIGIGEVKNALSWIVKKPFSQKNKLLLIYNATALTADAQNALLKVAEEPPTYSLIVLLAKNLNDLLPTLLSRCQQIRVEFQESTTQPLISFKNFYQMSVGERLDWCAESYKEEREILIDTLETWLSEIHNDLRYTPDTVKWVIKVKSDLENTNINARLALETLSISLTN